MLLPLRVCRPFALRIIPSSRDTYEPKLTSLLQFSPLGMEFKGIDLTDRVFGRLTVLGMDGIKGRHKYHDVYWRTVCECGGKSLIPAGS